jgi:hypothetical protein
MKIILRHDDGTDELLVDDLETYRFFKGTIGAHKMLDRIEAIARANCAAAPLFPTSSEGPCS